MPGPEVLMAARGRDDHLARPTATRVPATPEMQVEKANADIPNDQLYAAIPTLTYLARGGRIGALAGMLGNVLALIERESAAKGGAA